MINRFLLTTILAALLAGCPGQWVKVDNDRLVTTNFYKATLPSGWIKIENDSISVDTKDTPDLPKNTLADDEHHNAFPNTVLGASPELLASE